MLQNNLTINDIQFSDLFDLDNIQRIQELATPELKDNLFLLNVKTSRKGTDGEPSTGLGLLLCKEFIEKHNGEISLESEPGVGSCFFLTVPVKKSGEFINIR